MDKTPEISTLQLKDTDVLSEGWNQPFRSVSTEQIQGGTNLDLQFKDVVVNLSTEPESANTQSIAKRPKLETSRVLLSLNIMLSKGKSFRVHVKTPDNRFFKGNPTRSKDGNVIGFSSWFEATGKTPDNHIKYSQTAKPLPLTALNLQNSQIKIDNPQDSFEITKR